MEDQLKKLTTAVEALTVSHQKHDELTDTLSKNQESLVTTVSSLTSTVKTIDDSLSRISFQGTLHWVVLGLIGTAVAMLFPVFVRLVEELL